MKKRQVMVTGGAGFIGGHLVNYLTELGIIPIIIDDFSTGRLDNLPLVHDSYSLINADVGDANVMSEAVQQSTVVIHLAAVVGMFNVVSNPMKTIHTNIDAVRNLADLCARFEVPLVYISSSAVYRNSEQISPWSFKETDYVHSAGLHPVSTYSESKSLGELICDSYCRSHGLKCLIVRPFNLIGPRQASGYGMVVPRFVRLTLADAPLPIYGDGSQTRTFSDVRQAVRLLWALVAQTSWNCDVVNLATNDQAISILELAQLVSNVAGRPLQYRFVDYENVYGDGFKEVLSRRPSLNVIKKQVGTWTPIPLEETIASVIEYEATRIEVEAAEVSLGTWQTKSPVFC